MRFLLSTWLTAIHSVVLPIVYEADNFDVWPTKVHRWVRTLLQGSRLPPTLYEAVVIYPEYWALSATLEVLQHGDFIAVCPGISTAAFNIEFVVTITEISTNSTLNNGQAYIHIYYPAY